MRSLTNSGFRAWSKAEVASILTSIEVVTTGMLQLWPDSREHAAFQAGHELTMQALYAAFELLVPKSNC